MRVVEFINLTEGWKGQSLCLALFLLLSYISFYSWYAFRRHTLGRPCPASLTTPNSASYCVFSPQYGRVLSIVRWSVLQVQRNGGELENVESWVFLSPELALGLAVLHLSSCCFRSSNNFKGLWSPAWQVRNDICNTSLLQVSQSHSVQVLLNLDKTGQALNIEMPSCMSTGHRLCG